MAGIQLKSFIIGLVVAIAVMYFMKSRSKSKA
jgi:hypothetical protein